MDRTAWHLERSGEEPRLVAGEYEISPTPGDPFRYYLRQGGRLLRFPWGRGCELRGWPWGTGGADDGYASVTAAIAAAEVYQYPDRTGADDPVDRLWLRPRWHMFLLGRRPRTPVLKAWVALSVERTPAGYLLTRSAETAADPDGYLVEREEAAGYRDALEAIETAEEFLRRAREEPEPDPADDALPSVQEPPRPAREPAHVCREAASPKARYVAGCAGCSLARIRHLARLDADGLHVCVPTPVGRRTGPCDRCDGVRECLARVARSIDSGGHTCRIEAPLKVLLPLLRPCIGCRRVAEERRAAAEASGRHTCRLRPPEEWKAIVAGACSACAREASARRLEREAFEARMRTPEAVAEQMAEAERRLLDWGRAVYRATGRCGVGDARAREVL